MKSYFRNKTVILVFILPTLILFTVFVSYPIIPLFITSLSKHDGIASYGFVGLKNYIDIFSSQLLLKSNFNTIIITVGTIILIFPLTIFLAVLIGTMDIRFKKLFKTIYFIPVIISTVIICQTWIAIYQPEWGLLNTIFRELGLNSFKTEWLSNKFLVLPCVIIVVLWQYTGFNLMVLYAGVKNIPTQYYEAALIDGASWFQSARKITVPLLSEVVKFLLFTSILSGMATFDPIKIMTNGGPGDSSYTLIYMIYDYAFTRSNFGEGSAISIFFILQCLVYTVLLNKFTSKETLQF